MSYTPPAGNAANFSWVGVPAYTPPAGDAANFSWAATGVTATCAGTLGFSGATTAAHGVAVVAAGALAFTGSATVEHSSAVVECVADGALDFTGAASVAHGVSAQAAGALDFTGAGAAAHGIAATCTGTLGFTGACAALHRRYEVRGEVRLGGVLVNRRVRCSKRATGELMGQADTVAGVYRVHAGFDAAEVYVTAIDMADAATDWIPPTANRLVPVLASDTA